MILAAEFLAIPSSAVKIASERRCAILGHSGVEALVMKRSNFQSLLTSRVIDLLVCYHAHNRNSIRPISSEPQFCAQPYRIDIANANLEGWCIGVLLGCNDCVLLQCSPLLVSAILGKSLLPDQVLISKTFRVGSVHVCPHWSESCINLIGGIRPCSRFHFLFWRLNLA